MTSKIEELALAVPEENNEARGKLSYDETSKRTGIRKNTLYNLVAQGRIPHIRIGRRFVLFDPQDIDDWLTARKVVTK